MSAARPARPADQILRLSIWSGPRNVSTALMYAFRQRRDTIVFDEPLYGPYLQRTRAPHPDREQVLAQLEGDADRIIREVLLGDAPLCGTGTRAFAETGRPGRVPEGTRVRMYKNMAHHLRVVDRDFLDGLENVLLTRDPREMLPSLARRLERPTLDDTGLPEQVELLERGRARGRTPLVLTARRLLEDPEGTLRRLCDRLALPYDPAMTSWPAGPKPEDGVWAHAWYANVHRSTGFAPYRPKQEPLPARLEPLLDECAPLYARLEANAL